MKKIFRMHLSKFLIALVLLTITACSGNKKLKEPTINVEIPTELQNNPEVLAYINLMVEEATKMAKSTQQLIQITGGADIDSSSELSAMQMLKMSKVGIQMYRATSKMEEYRAQRKTLNEKLTKTEIASLDLICAEIENQMMKIDTTGLGINKAEIIAQEEKQKQHKAEIAKANSNRLEQMTDEERNSLNESQTEVTESSSSFLSSGFPILVLFIVGASVAFGIKRLRSKIKNISYSLSHAESTLEDLKNNSESVIGKGNKLNKEEQKNIQNLMDLLNKKTN